MKNLSFFYFSIDLNVSYQDIHKELLDYYDLSINQNIVVESVEEFRHTRRNHQYEPGDSVCVTISDQQYNRNIHNESTFDTANSIEIAAREIVKHLSVIVDKNIIVPCMDKTYNSDEIDENDGVVTIKNGDSPIIFSDPNYNFVIIKWKFSEKFKIIKLEKNKQNGDYMNKSEHTEAQNHMQQAKNSLVMTSDESNVSITTSGSISLSSEQKTMLSDMVTDIADILESKTGIEGFLEDVEEFKSRKNSIVWELETEFNELIGRYNEYYKQYLNMIDYDSENMSVSFSKIGRVIYISPTKIVNVSDYNSPDYVLVNYDFFVPAAMADDEFKAKYVVEGGGLSFTDSTKIDFPFKTVSVNGSVMIIEKLDM